MAVIVGQIACAVMGYVFFACVTYALSTPNRFDDRAFLCWLWPVVIPWWLLSKVPPWFERMVRRVRRRWVVWRLLRSKP